MSWRNSSPAVPPIARWVLVLLAGGTWLVVAWSVPRFDLTAIEQTAWLTCGLLLFAAFAELVHVASTETWRRTHAGLALMSFAAGGLCLLNVRDGVVGLTAVVGFFLLARGAVDAGLASVDRTAEPVWMVLVGLGIAEAVVGFWSAARFVTDVTGVVVTLAVFALLRGIADTVTALRLRESRTGAHAADAHGYVAGHADYTAATMNTVTARHRAGDTRPANTSDNTDEGTQPGVFAMAPSGTAAAGGASRPGGPAPGGRFGSDGSGGFGSGLGAAPPGPADVPPAEHTAPEEEPSPAEAWGTERAATTGNQQSLGPVHARGSGRPRPVSPAAPVSSALPLSAADRATTAGRGFPTGSGAAPTPEPGIEAATSTGSTGATAGPIPAEGEYTGRRRSRDPGEAEQGAGTVSPRGALPEDPLDGPSGMNVTRTPVHRAGPGEDMQAGRVGPLTNAPYWSGFGAADEGLADRGRDVPVAGLSDEMIGRAQVAGMTGYPRFTEGLAEADGGKALPGRTGAAGTPMSFAERVPPVEHTPFAERVPPVEHAPFAEEAPGLDQEVPGLPPVSATSSGRQERPEVIQDPAQSGLPAFRRTAAGDGSWVQSRPHGQPHPGGGPGDSGSAGQIRAGMIIPLAPPSVQPEPIETSRSAYRTPAPEPTTGREAPAEEATARKAESRETEGGSSMAAWFGAHGRRRS